MIPLRDTIPSRTFPIVTILLIVINGIVFLFELSLGEHLNSFVNFFGIIPAKYFYYLSKDLNIILAFFPFLTSQFLHGGWFHLIGNVWFLWIFGDNVEDHIGHFKFLLFYLACGVLAGLAHVCTNPASEIPTVGASGAIAGIMGAYTILYPRARVLTLVPIFFFIQFIELPAYLFLGIWFLIQSFSGITSLAGDQGCCGVAWWAHIGGFVVGTLSVIFLFPRKKKKRYWVKKDGEIKDFFDV